MMLYPLKFKPILKDKLWGGQKIKTILGKNLNNLSNCGESWEISAVEGNMSFVSNGFLTGKSIQSLIYEYKGKLVGSKIYEQFGDHFPLLIKFIDAYQDLSIQVHPDDDLAAIRHNSFGKTEMWYIMQADKNSSLICGFNQTTDREKYLEYFYQGKLTDLLNVEYVKRDDVFLLPAGRIHNIGKGLLIAEVQQTSDITYRIYDFDRKDEQGNKREIHLKESLDAIDYSYHKEYKTAYRDKINAKVALTKCLYFTTNKLILNQNYNVILPKLDCFKIYICLKEEATFTNGKERVKCSMGDVLLIPAIWTEYTIEIKTTVTLLEVYIEE